MLVMMMVTMVVILVMMVYLVLLRLHCFCHHDLLDFAWTRAVPGPGPAGNGGQLDGLRGGHTGYQATFMSETGLISDSVLVVVYSNKYYTITPNLGLKQV